HAGSVEHLGLVADVLDGDVHDDELALGVVVQEVVADPGYAGLDVGHREGERPVLDGVADAGGLLFVAAFRAVALVVLLVAGGVALPRAGGVASHAGDDRDTADEAEEYDEA